MRRIRRPSHATVVAYIALFLVLSGGTAVALNGSNNVFTDDIANDNIPASGGNPAGGLVAADLRPNSVGTSEITNGTVSVSDTNKVIPSGATVTGAFRERENCSGCSSVFLEFSVDFHGLRAPTPLTDANINFDDIGISATAAAASEEDSGCTGTLAAPTAPPGKVCIYVHHEILSDNNAYAQPLSNGTPFTEVDTRGFRVAALNFSGTEAVLGAVWAYRAP